MPRTRHRLSTCFAAVVLLALPLTLAAPARAGLDADPTIVGGSPATTSQYPWVVSIQNDLIGGGTDGHLCGGTLVASTKVVTAAHCVVGIQPALTHVVAGRTDLRTTDGVEANVLTIVRHPLYNEALNSYDVAVITLDRAITYQTLPWATAADSDIYAAGTMAKILGWGLVKEDGDASPTLLQADVPTTSDAYCSTAYGVSYDPTTMVCAGYPQGGVDTCQGDSGGPFVIDGKLAGITSWGEGCAQPRKPGVYTRVSAVADFIDAGVNTSVP